MASGDRIYSGCFMEFGYWEKDDYGGRVYHSLSQTIHGELLEDEQFWKIQMLDDWILFQSLQRIYAYRISEGSFEIIPSESSRAQLFTFGGDIYFLNQGGLFTVRRGKSVPVAASGRENLVIVGVSEIGDRTVFITEEGTFLTLDQDSLIPWNPTGKPELPECRVYSSIQLGDGSIALGTISQGIFILGTDGGVIQHIDREKGLNNNTVLDMFEDRDGNLWLALDNGISVINRSAAIWEFNDAAGRLGVVYTAAVYRGRLYLGTNQGLFRNEAGGTGTDGFRAVPGTEGQVWALKEIDGTLFCGHNRGTFIIENGQARLISDRAGTWDIIEVPGTDTLLLQGNYQGLSVLAKRRGDWALRNALAGFDNSSRFFQFTPSGTLKVNHEYKGVYTLEAGPDLREVEILGQRPPWGVGASLFQYRDTLYYATNNAIYSYDQALSEFGLDSLKTEMMMDGSDNPVGVLVPDPASDRLWGFANRSIKYLDPSPLDGVPVVRKIDVPGDFRRDLGVLGFECLTPLGGDRYLIGRSDGFVILDLNKIQPKEPEVQITSVRKEAGNQTPQSLTLSGVPELGYQKENITITYNVPEYGKFREVEYQYRLKGYQEDWGKWTTTPRVTFSNMPFGTYDFEVRARLGEEQSGAPATYSFKVLRPWYLTWWAFGGYLVALGLMAFFVNRLYRSHYQQQQVKIMEENRRKAKRNKLRAKKKIMEIRNAKLQHEIDSKNRELAVSTMSLIKKNEFLNSIKDQLRAVKETSDIRAVIRTIDRNISNEDDWKFFEEAFTNADKDFLHKIKEAHPELTPNDLKLCAYLRLNLSSKEIAPLLNISVRSVEVKRYRLRKKMDLAHEKGLTEYILEI